MSEQSESGRGCELMSFQPDLQGPVRRPALSLFSVVDQSRGRQIHLPSPPTYSFGETKPPTSISFAASWGFLGGSVVLELLAFVAASRVTVIFSTVITNASLLPWLRIQCVPSELARAGTAAGSRTPCLAGRPSPTVSRYGSRPWRTGRDGPEEKACGPQSLFIPGAKWWEGSTFDWLRQRQSMASTDATPIIGSANGRVLRRLAEAPDALRPEVSKVTGQPTSRHTADRRPASSERADAEAESGGRCASSKQRLVWQSSTRNGHRTLCTYKSTRVSEAKVLGPDGNHAARGFEWVSSWLQGRLPGTTKAEAVKVPCDCITVIHRPASRPRCRFANGCGTFDAVPPSLEHIWSTFGAHLEYFVRLEQAQSTMTKVPKAPRLPFCGLVRALKGIEPILFDTASNQGFTTSEGALAIHLQYSPGVLTWISTPSRTSSLEPPPSAPCSTLQHAVSTSFTVFILRSHCFSPVWPTLRGATLAGRSTYRSTVPCLQHQPTSGRDGLTPSRDQGRRASAARRLPDAYGRSKCSRHILARDAPSLQSSPGICKSPSSARDPSQDTSHPRDSTPRLGSPSQQLQRSLDSNYSSNYQLQLQRSRRQIPQR
ncbi:hypothetical protein G7046_g3260 [Stylonectria norvegica]|nr:hypothetical protein G7046_g3260 [Stylonectria norvegica]